MSWFKNGTEDVASVSASPGDAVEVSASGQPAPAGGHARAANLTATKSSRGWPALDAAIYGCLLLFVVALAHSKAVTEIAYSVATLLWVVRLIARRERPWQQPLTMALFAFLLLSAVSCTVSLAPALSWERMKSVGLLIIAPLFAQNVKSLRQVRALIAVLLLSTMASVGYNAFLYTYGYGAKITSVTPGSVLGSLGAIPGDMVVAVNGHRTHNPAAFVRAAGRTDASQPVKLQLARGEALERYQLQLAPGALAKSGLLAPGALTRGRPVRAQGSLGYVVTYAEVLLQLTLLTWGLLLAATISTPVIKRYVKPNPCPCSLDWSGEPESVHPTAALERPSWRSPRLAMWALFVAWVLMCATLGATLTRASMASCFVGSTIAFWICIRNRWVRAVSIAVIALAVLTASVLVQRGRGLGMVAAGDAGTEYRVLMWEDGVRLAEQHPLFGVGMDTIKAQWQQLHVRAYERFTLHSHFHSTPIQLAAERGLLTSRTIIR